MAAHRGTHPGDVVLVHYQGKPASFARIDDVRPHGRPGWFLCDLLVLAVPPQPVTWILERAQIDGTEFTMGGQPVRLERLADLGTLHAAARSESDAASAGAAEAPEAPGEEASEKGGRKTAARARARRAEKVVPLFPRK